MIKSLGEDDEQRGEKKQCLGNAWTYYDIVPYTKMIPGFRYRN